MYDYSLEEAKARIVDSRTKSSFEEVYSSYTHCNFRSSIVMLWSVVICDIIYKLQDARDIWSDEKARDILDKISRLQAEKPKNSEWESLLISEVATRTKLISNSDKINIDHLHTHRHLCAHPVLDGSAELLLSPSREIARSHLRSMLESVLTKPSIMSKEIFNTFITDIAKNKQMFSEGKSESFKKYLTSRFFSNMNTEVEYHIFRTLWKFVFNLDNVEAKENLVINWCALGILFERNRKSYILRMRESSDYYSNSCTTDRIYHLAAFLRDYPDVFQCLSEALKEVLRKKAETGLYCCTAMIPLSDNPKQHFSKVIELVKRKDSLQHDKNIDDYISATNWDFLLRLACDENCMQEIKELAITLYAKSSSYDSANVAFARFISSTLEFFEGKDFITFFEMIKDNAQAYDRKKAYHDHQLVLSKAKLHLPKDFDYSKYSYLPAPATVEIETGAIADLSLGLE